MYWCWLCGARWRECGKRTLIWSELSMAAGMRHPVLLWPRCYLEPVIGALNTTALSQIQQGQECSYYWNLIEYVGMKQIHTHTHVRTHRTDTSIQDRAKHWSYSAIAASLPQTNASYSRKETTLAYMKLWLEVVPSDGHGIVRGLIEWPSNAVLQLLDECCRDLPTEGKGQCSCHQLQREHQHHQNEVLRKC